MPTALRSLLARNRTIRAPSPRMRPPRRIAAASAVIGLAAFGAVVHAQPRAPGTTGTPPASMLAGSRAEQSWHVLIEQGGTVHALERKPVLKLAPFTLLFTGPASYAYALIAVRHASALPAAPDFATMKALVQPDRLAPEKSDRTDHELTINDDASIAARTAIAHLWVEDAARDAHAFLRFDVAPDGRAIAVRPVSSLCRPSFRIDRPDCRDLSEIAARQALMPKRPRRPAPSARSPEDFAILVAAIPAGRLTRFETPRVYEIRFAPAP
ncbi:MAG: hypothetical protein QM766_01680 [Burkholderiaceae bacterium]